MKILSSGVLRGKYKAGKVEASWVTHKIFQSTLPRRGDTEGDRAGDGGDRAGDGGDTEGDGGDRAGDRWRDKRVYSEGLER